jgi:tellurite resistance protein TehA-like permease
MGTDDSGGKLISLEGRPIADSPTSPSIPRFSDVRTTLLAMLVLAGLSLVGLAVALRIGSQLWLAFAIISGVIGAGAAILAIAWVLVPARAVSRSRRR